MQRYTSLTKFDLCQGRHQTWSRGKFSRDAERRGLTAGFHQLSMRYTRDASVRLSATPPAFRLTRNIVTSTLFTRQREGQNKRRAQADEHGFTEVLNSGVTRLRAHCPLEPANLKPARHQSTFEPMKGTDFTEKPARCSRNAIRSKKLTNWLNTMLFVVES